MATYIHGDLHGTDTKDKNFLSRRAGTYDYEITVSDGGTLYFKVMKYSPALLGESGGGHWYTIEPKRKLESGHTYSGTFVVPETILSSSVSTEWTRIKIVFSRKLFTSGVDYYLEFQRR